MHNSTAPQKKSPLARPWLAAVIVVLAATAAACSAFAAAPVAEPYCDSKMIAAHAPTMPIADFLEVIDFLQDVGALTQEYADHLRALIAEAYSASDLAAWAQERCAKG